MTRDKGAEAPDRSGMRALVFAAPGQGPGADPEPLTGAAALDAARVAAGATPVGWVWLDITAPDVGLLHTLESTLRLSRSVLHEAVRAESRSHFKEHPGHAFLLLQVPAAGNGGAADAVGIAPGGSGSARFSGARFPTQRLGLCLRSGLLVTLHAEPIPLVDAAWIEFAGGPGQSDELHPDRLLHALAEDVLALFLPVADRVEERIDSLERAVFSGRNRQPLDRVLGLKRDLLAMRRTMAPLRDAFSAAARRDSVLLPAATRVLLGDLYDRSLRIMDILENLRDLLASLLDAHLTVQSHRLSEIMRTLTVIATLMMPLTVITGYFGMNFVHLPGLGSTAAVWMVTGAMGLLAVAMLVYFRLRGWY